VISPEQLARLRHRAHVHDAYWCYGRYEPCGEHHVHDDTCGGRSLLCRIREDKDLVALVEEYDRQRVALDALAEIKKMHLP
jgi:hypothetical protein